MLNLWWILISYIKFFHKPPRRLCNYISFCSWNNKLSFCFYANTCLHCCKSVVIAYISLCIQVNSIAIIYTVKSNWCVIFSHQLNYRHKHTWSKLQKCTAIFCICTFSWKRVRKSCKGCFNVNYIPDFSTFCDIDKLLESRTICCFYSFHENHAFFFCTCIQYFTLFFGKWEWFFRKHMFSCFYSFFCIFKMCFVRWSYIHGIYIFKKFFIIACIALYFLAFFKSLCTLLYRIVSTFYRKSTYIFWFRYKSRCDSPRTYYANSYNFKLFFSKKCWRNIGRSLKIDYFTEGIKIIKCSYPVWTNSKYIRTVFLNIFNFLPIMIFNNNHVGKTCLFDILYTLNYRVNNIDLTPCFVKMLSCNANY